MLTREENERLTRIGPGTPGGALLRRYWQPVALEDELPVGGAPVPVRLLGEDLVLYRDEAGAPGLLGLHCPHRGADLSYGRLEDGGLRCLYHGWLFNREGRCLEQPGEPAGSTFYQRIRHTAYPCREAGGLIMAYLGPGEPPLLPPYELFDAPPTHRWATKLLHDCSYLQANEGNIDPSHLSYLHRQFDQTQWHSFRMQKAVNGANASSMELFGRDSRPTIEAEETDFGVRIFSVRRTGPDQLYVRISNFVLPNLAAFPGRTEHDGYQVHWHVPIDDTHHWKYIITFRRSGPIDPDLFRAEMAPSVTADFRKPHGPAERYGQDRVEMQTRTFSGMGANFHTHDAYATESQGPIQNRPAEQLGTTDRAIILARRLLLRAVRDVEEGRDPPHVFRSTDQRLDLVVRGEGVPSTTDWKTYWREPAEPQGAGAR